MKRTLALTCLIFCYNITKCGNFFNTPLLLTKSESIPNIKQEQKKTLASSTFVPKKLSEKKEDLYSNLRMLAEVIDLMERKSFKKVNFKTFIEEALIAACPKGADAHTAFFTSDSFKQTKQSTSGTFPGIGVTVVSKETDDDKLKVTDVVVGGPADKAGVLANDQIINIDGSSLRGISSDNVIRMLRGDYDKKKQASKKDPLKIDLKVIRGKQIIEFSFKREIIKNKVTTSYYFENQGIHFIHLGLFTENAASNVEDVLKKVDKKTKGIILDLRRNPGGVIDAAIDMASLFLKKNSLVVSTKNRDGKTVMEYKTKRDPILKQNIPVIILTDPITASAAEIVTGALKHYSASNNTHPSLMVFVLGSPTYGKGSVQEVIPISNGCALKLTTMLYYLPNNISIQATGIQPDFIVTPRIVAENEMKLMKELVGKENTNKNHITREETLKNSGNKAFTNEPVKTAENKPKSLDDRIKESLLKDIHIQKAASMISILHLAKKHSPSKVDTRNKAIDFMQKNLLSDDTVKIAKT